MRFLLAFLCSGFLVAQAPFEGKAGPTVKAAYDLLDQGKFNEAAAKFQEAMKSDPASSFPISGLAKLYFQASQATDPGHQSEYKMRAQTLARQALDKNDLDFVANEVLLNLDGASMGSAHQPKPDAISAFNEAETAYGAMQWDKAASAYKRALDLDPQFTNAALYLGDVYYMQKQYSQAEPWFRKATEMEPRYARAWRFLTDCLGHMDRVKDAYSACLGAIAAQPNDYTAWGRLRQVNRSQGYPALIRFHWPEVDESQIKKDKDGRLELLVPTLKSDDSAEGDAMSAYTLMSGLTRVPVKDGVKRSELESRVES